MQKQITYNSLRKQSNPVLPNHELAPLWVAYQVTYKEAEDSIAKEQNTLKETWKWLLCAA